MNELWSDPFERLLEDAATPAVVREIEGGASPAALWARLEASGFLEALVPEDCGGAGLRLTEAFGLFAAEGRHALPVPASHTMLARAALAREGLAAPAGMIAIAPRARLLDDGTLACALVPCGRIADWVAVEQPAGWRLMPTAGAERQATGVHGSLRANLRWPIMPAGALEARASVAWSEAGAAVTAAQLAGAMERVLAMTLRFADERVQFGRSIGKFQSIQHQLAVLAEQVSAARMAAEIGCSGPGALPGGLRAALAKARASEAATFATSISHAVHGAIGVTAEFDLQIFTRRLHEWRADFGAETHWNRVLGRALLAHEGDTLDFMRAALIPSNEEIAP